MFFQKIFNIHYNRVEKSQKRCLYYSPMYPKLLEILGQIAPIMEAFSKGLKITNIKYTM